jgi:hypothetical protein
VCTWFYAEKATLSPIITKAQQLPLTDTIRNTMSRSAEMSGNIRPTDMAAVFAPNKQGNMAVYCKWVRLAQGCSRFSYIGLKSTADCGIIESIRSAVC